MLVLQVACEEKGIGGKFRRGIGTTHLVRHKLRSGCFYEITICGRNDRVRWKKIRRAVKQRPVCMVMDRALQPPDGCGIQKYSSQRFKERLLFQTFMQAVDAVRPETAGFVDETGKLARAAEVILPSVGQLRICTPCYDAYEELMQRAVAEYGTAPLISADRSVLRDTSAVYLSQGDAPPGCGVLFSHAGGYGVAEDALNLPEDVRVAIPPTVSPLDFVAAAVDAHLMDAQEVTCRVLAKNGGVNTLRGIYKLMG